MAFIAKPDYFGLGSNAALTLKSSTENNGASVAEAQNEVGDVIAQEVFGEQASPSVTYELKADLALSGVKLGSITTIDGKAYALTGFTCNTAPATVPEIQCSGEQVEDGATTANSTTIALPALTLKKWHDAQILGEAFTLGGQGCYLNGCNYSVSADLTKANVDGLCVAHDIQNGRIEVQVTIVQSGNVHPTLTAGQGWVITSPLSTDNPDEDYPTWTATLVKTLTSAHPSSGNP